MYVMMYIVPVNQVCASGASCIVSFSSRKVAHFRVRFFKMFVVYASSAVYVCVDNIDEVCV